MEHLLDPHYGTPPGSALWNTSWIRIFEHLLDPHYGTSPGSALWNISWIRQVNKLNRSPSKDRARTAKARFKNMLIILL